MLPEKVYSTKWHTPKRNEHCNVKSVYGFTDLNNVIVDTDKNFVMWNKHYGLTEDAKQRQRAYYIKQGKSEVEAGKAVNLEKKRGCQVKCVTDIHTGTRSPNRITN